MTAQHNEKSPAPVAAGNEGNELGKRSTTAAYLSYNPDNTRHTFGTWGGDDLPKTDFIRVILPFKTVQKMYADGPQLIGLNKACAENQSREVRLRREEQLAKERAERRRQLSNEIEEEFADELHDLESKMDAIYTRINARADALLDAQDEEKSR